MPDPEQATPQASPPGPAAESGPPPAIGYAQRGTPEPAGPLEPYNRTAETIGMMPSLRWKDNVFQAVAIVIGTILGALIGYYGFGNSIPGPQAAALLGAVAGLIGSTLLSGLFLMILRMSRRG